MTQTISMKFLTPLLLLALVGCWLYGLYGVPTDVIQGEVYRIIYIHVPFAFAAFFSALVLFIFSLQTFRQPKNPKSTYAQATAEVGLFFTLLTLFTGSIWGKPTWGTWWTWDARLTTTFVLALLYSGYLLLNITLERNILKHKICGVLGILIFLDVPIIYQSVNWWRTLHQPQSILRSGGPTMSHEILSHLLLSAFITITLCCWLIWQRYLTLEVKEEVTEQLHTLA